MIMVATLSNPASTWSSPLLRQSWLTVHIVLVLLGMGGAAAGYGRVGGVSVAGARTAVQEAHANFYYRLPALGTLDELISGAMGLGFVLMMLGGRWKA